MRRHNRWLFRYICRYVRNPADAQDVLQDSLVSAWQGLSGYDPARPLPIWLRRIALNKCRDQARRFAVRYALLSWRASDPETHSVADPGMAPDDRLIENQSLRCLRDAVDALPAVLRDPLILTAIEDLSQGEAAEVLGISVKAVEGRVHRAKKQLGRDLHLEIPGSRADVEGVFSLCWRLEPHTPNP
jgi:RNA polymerase sigma-70 factor (ECF subfamily)